MYQFFTSDLFGVSVDTANMIANGIAGAIVNRCASERHHALIEEGFDRAGVPLLGTIARSRDVQVPSRHLGLVQAGEQGGLDHLVADASALVGEAITQPSGCK